MTKTVIVALVSFFILSGLLILIGYQFEIQLFMFQFYKETATGFEAGGSVLPFIIALICSCFIGNYYQTYQK
ncbi:hypothetical protein [Halalkalibacter urbisdiaboli]|uniref:hypothetical protein n=1 Tax=Halalkalibacter urbisdiaboli TaxID=1960589 RepID=UPI000B454CB7|nr:hypothetical protein [Halalkalibacter urbisdiaboli]